METRKVNPYVSVDCVLLGFDGERLNVLLVRQRGRSGEGNDTGAEKLPGSLIYMDEGLDEAAQRVLRELTGLERVQMMQFHAFGELDRIANPRDRVWLERFHSLHEGLERIVTVGYLSLLRIDRKLADLGGDFEARWVPAEALPELAFDHGRIVEGALEAVRAWSQLKFEMIFDLLPRKFTASQLHAAYEALTGRRIDFRNFHKKMHAMPFIVPLEEKQQGVSHRAGRYFRFDRKGTSGL